MKRMRLLSSEKGMTLLEIMIVLVIVGTLIGILGQNVATNLKKAKVKQARILIAEVSKALDMYYTDCNQYPTTDEGLNALVAAPSSCTNWGPDPYLRHLNKDPWGGDLLYEQNGSTYIVKSLGADHKEGGQNDNADISSEQL